MIVSNCIDSKLFLMLHLLTHIHTHTYIRVCVRVYVGRAQVCCQVVSYFYFIPDKWLVSEFNVLTIVYAENEENQCPA